MPSNLSVSVCVSGTTSLPLTRSASIIFKYSVIECVQHTKRSVLLSLELRKKKMDASAICAVQRNGVSLIACMHAPMSVCIEWVVTSYVCSAIVGRLSLVEEVCSLKAGK